LKYPRGTRDNPALNCQEILDGGKFTKNGNYIRIITYFII